MEFSPYEKSIHSLTDAMAKGTASSTSLTDYYLERIEKYNGDRNGINAIIAVNPHAREIAEELDMERKAGKLRGCLHGVPLLIKDNINTEDMPTTGSCIELKDCRPQSDAHLVKLLRDAGAVILGKGNLTELARNGLSVGSLGGQSRNPYDLTRTPGGSSGGIGAGIAMNFAAAGIGTDTVNSVRSPSSACSLAGMRPTTGLVSREGLIPCSMKQDTAGPLARTVEDCALLLDVMRGYDPRDTLTADQIGRVPDVSYTSFLSEDGLRGKRLGILKTNLGNDPDVTAVMERSFRLLENAGAQLTEVDIPELETDRVFSECDVQRYETGLLLDRYFAGIPGCPVKSLKDLVSRHTLHESVTEDLEACACAEGPFGEGIRKKLENVARNTRLASDAMKKHNLHALVYPHQQILVVKTGAPSQAKRNGIVASTMGWPAITVPAGFSAPDENAPQGVPVGIEFMAMPYREPLLFEIASSYESLTHFRKPPLTGKE